MTIGLITTYILLGSYYYIFADSWLASHESAGGGFHTMHESTSGRPTAAARPIRRPFAQTLRLSALTTCVVFGCIIITIRAVASTSTATVAGVCSVRKDKVLPWLRVATSLHDLLLN